MSKNTTISHDVETLKKLQKELVEKKALMKDAERLTEWECKTSARNPAYVMGSIRKPTPEEVSTLGHTHGVVCEIRCQECGKVRVINKQDAFQVRYCRNCYKDMNKALNKEKRQMKKMENVSRDDLEKQIAELTALLESKVA